MAHIIAESPDGPRGDSPLTLEQRDLYPNLILLCNNHHQLIDDPAHVHTYTVERLHTIKEEHEAWVEKSLSRGDGESVESLPTRNVTETLYSNLFAISEMPKYIYGVPCKAQSERDIVVPRTALRTLPRVSGSDPQLEMAPYIVRAGMLYVFQDLNDTTNPFQYWVQARSVERYDAGGWWNDPDKMRWYVDLLNRAMNKLTGRLGLRYDRDHRRYYFHPTEPGKPMKIRYKSLNSKQATRSVVWEPKQKSTGEGRGYWLHRAVSLRFTRYDNTHWFLGVRPELRATLDGREPLASEKIGSKVNRQSSRRFNYDLLGEVHFWRDYLSCSSPRIILPFGPNQRIVISSTPMNCKVSWPGIPKEHAKPFTNVEYVDDLLTWAEFNALDDNWLGPDWDEDDESAEQIEDEE